MTGPDRDRYWALQKERNKLCSAQRRSQDALDLFDEIYGEEHSRLTTLQHEEREPEIDF